MNPQVPPPPRPRQAEPGSIAPAGPGASCTGASYHPAIQLPPSTATTTTTPSIKPTISTTFQECVLGGGHFHTTPSEEDMVIYGKPVHVHGSLSKHQPVEVPVHHGPHGTINYAKAAKEEMKELHEHPGGTGVAAVLLPGAKTGVEMWDKVEEELPSRRSKHQ